MGSQRQERPGHGRRLRWRHRLWAAAWAIGACLPGTAAMAEGCPEAVALFETRGAVAPIAALPGQGRLEEALALLGLQDGTPAGLPAGMGDWLAGRWLEEAGRLEEAVQRLRGVIGRPVEDDARFRLGRILLRLGDLAGAREALSGIPAVSRYRGEARMLLARVLIGEGRLDAAAVLLWDLARDDLTQGLRSRAVRLLAEVRTAQGRLEEALALLRRAWIEVPGREAEREIREALAAQGAPPGALDRALREWMEASPDQVRRLAREARRHPRSMERLDPGWPLLVQGQAARLGDSGSERAPAWFVQADREARDPRIRAMARQAMGDVLVTLGRDREAMDAYASVGDADTGGVLEGDAALSRVRCAFRLGHYEEGYAALDRLEAGGALSVSRSESEWERVRGLLIQGRSEEALGWLERAVRRRGPGEGLVGGDLERWVYYRGTTRLATGDRVGGLADLERVAGNAPHTWYGLLAARRLAAAGPSGDPRTPRRTTCRDSLAPLWWMAVGEDEEAARELDARLAAGVVDPAARESLMRMLASSPDPRTRARARRLLGGAVTPTDDLYPMPFSAEVEAAASESGLPRGLLWAVARVESGFRPGARSPRGARGLMQLLPPVARRVATLGLGEPGLARRWTAPGVNLRLGATWLGALIRHFQGHLPLALAAYHAGPAAARRFLIRLGRLPTDLFVDSLPYPGTLRYVQSVLALDGGYRQRTGEEAWAVDPGAPPPPDPGPFRWTPGTPPRPEAFLPGAAVRSPSLRRPPTGHPGDPRGEAAVPPTGG